MKRIGYVRTNQGTIYLSYQCLHDEFMNLKHILSFRYGLLYPWAQMHVMSGAKLLEYRSESLCNRWVKKVERKSLRRSRKPMLSDLTGEEHSFVAWPEESIESNHFFRWDNFRLWSVFNKPNDRVAKFGKDVSKHRRMSTTKHPPQSWCLAS